MIFWIIVLAIVGCLVWIRLAPSNPEVWNVDPMVTADQDLASGVRRGFQGGRPTMEVLDRVILATPRTEILAGSIDAGLITYVTRSEWMGFPDYTTVQLNDDRVELYARLRFGQSDMGTNKARVEGWLSAVAAQQGD
ncbi:DUF1499 domain-containing protein [Puniceibacterium sp. IMCC21224]|uniref:DUF1499 domain-containing protein n=1 Tax=Puniceibacterium sp. IMCC21224 TaxID=1618204 RepID=UPI00064D9285|nr:DUF1499 domain-containing protein [Puniceibacterium sp. IMCC21224]KMK67025.1 Protein of unknown function (DUF1499) [Puniceibacterium sp. IMCC21224]